MNKKSLPILVSLRDEANNHVYLVVDLKGMKIHYYDPEYFDKVLHDLQKNFHLTNLQICEMLDTWNNKETTNEKD